MDIKRQERAPIYEALEEFKKKRVVPFDVPGHKRGRGNPELVHLLGEKCVGLDVNSMKPLDNLCHPVSVIREAEELAADAFGAANAFLMVGGTTSFFSSAFLALYSSSFFFISGLVCREYKGLTDIFSSASLKAAV